MLLLGRFIKALIVKPHDVQDAMDKLDRLSAQELQMVVANILAAVNHMRRKSFSPEDGASTDNSCFLFLQAMSFVHKLRIGSTHPTLLPITSLLWKHGTARPANGFWTQSSS